MGQPQRVLRLGLAGDTMLGRCVADVLTGSHQYVRIPVDRAPSSKHGSMVFSDGVVELAREADLMFLNLECCISNHDQRWPNPRKPFFFRAPPTEAIRELQLLQVKGVTLANNHALDYNVVGLLDTLEHLDHANIQVVGAGRDREEARRPIVLDSSQGFRIGVIGLTDHPEEFAATADRPGVAFEDLEVTGVPKWVEDAARRLKEEQRCDAVMVTPHWGPNTCPRPPSFMRRVAKALLQSPHVDLLVGHSAHHFMGAWGAAHALFGLGDFIDDYARDEDMRTDLGLFYFVLFDIDSKRPFRVEAVPLKLEFSHTKLARGDDYQWVKHRFMSMCAELGTKVHEEGGRLVFDLD